MLSSRPAEFRELVDRLTMEMKVYDTNCVDDNLTGIDTFLLNDFFYSDNNKKNVVFRTLSIVLKEEAKFNRSDWYRKLDFNAQALLATVNFIIREQLDSDELFYTCILLLCWPHRMLERLQFNDNLIDSIVSHPDPLARYVLTEQIVTMFYRNELIDSLPRYNGSNFYYLADCIQRRRHTWRKCPAEKRQQYVNSLTASLFINDDEICKANIVSYLTDEHLTNFLNLRSIVEFLEFEERNNSVEFLALKLIKSLDIRALDADVTYCLNTLLHIGNRECLKLASSIVCNIEGFKQSQYYHTYIAKLVELEHRSGYVVQSFNYLNLHGREIKRLSQLYPDCQIWVPLIHHNVADEDVLEYLDRCLDGGFKVKASISPTMSEIAPDIPSLLSKLCRLVGKYDKASEVLIKYSQNSVDLTEYLPIIIPECLKRIESKPTLELMICVFPLVKDKACVAGMVWPLLEKLPNSHRRNVLMATLCEVYEYVTKAFDYFNDWTQYLNRERDIEYKLLKALPRPIFRKFLADWLANGDCGLIPYLQKYPYVDQCDIFIADVYHDLKQMKVFYDDESREEGGMFSLWDINELTTSQFLQNLAWEECDLIHKDFYTIHSLRFDGKLFAPSDAAANKYFNKAYGEVMYCSGYHFVETMAFLYNNTNVKLHIKRIRELVCKPKPEGSQFSAALFLSLLIPSLNSVDYKDELLAILASSIVLPENKIHQNHIIKAMCILDDSEETKAMKSMLT